MKNKKNNSVALRHNNSELKNCLNLLFHMADTNIANHKKEKEFAKNNREALLEERKRLEAIDKANNVAEKILNLVHNTFVTADTSEGIIEDVDNQLGSLLLRGACGYSSQTGYVFDEKGLTITLDYSSIDYDDNCLFHQSILGSPDSTNINLEHLRQVLGEYGITFKRETGEIKLDDYDSVDLDVLRIFVPRVRTQEPKETVRA